MATTSPTRIDDELYASAKAAGEVMSRSAAQQIAHWARIGREIETGTSSHREIARVLAGTTSYDDLGSRDQAVVRARWSERMTGLRESLDLAEELAAEGVSYSELDSRGNVVQHGPGAAATPRPAAKRQPRKATSKPAAPARKASRKTA
jgi:hypothetical protein